MDTALLTASDLPYIHLWRYYGAEWRSTCETEIANDLHPRTHFRQSESDLRRDAHIELVGRAALACQTEMVLDERGGSRRYLPAEQKLVVSEIETTPLASELPHLEVDDLVTRLVGSKPFGAAGPFFTQ